jgi:gamma-glutamyltranspeptidase/glutathione hydrolase
MEFPMKLRFILPLLLAILTMPNALAASPEPFQAEHAVVVSASDLPSQVGADIMEKGGNAFDAAAATGFALAVTDPYAGNLGGGGFLVAHTADGRSITLDFRESAPAAAHEDMFLDAAGEVIPGLSLRSPLASGTPGSVDGLLKIWRDHGSGNISRRQLLAPAIKLASKGFPIPRDLAASLNFTRERFQKDPGASEIFVRKDGQLWQEGDRLIQKDLAKTLKRISRHGPDGFYADTTAELLADQQQQSGGLITLTDLQNYKSIYRDPVTGTYKEYEIVSMGPPSSGGILLIHMLNMLEPYDLKAFGWNSAQTIHLLTEVQRRAYADRALHLGDSDFHPVPLAWLGSKAYAHQRAKTIDPTKATPSTQINAGSPAQPESEETTHYSIYDQHGNAVSVTTTLNGGYGSAIVIQGAGFLMNNEMDDFSSKPGTPNLYGLIGSQANAIAPNKRMLSSMTPTIILKNDKPHLILGSPGGSTIITTVLQNFLNVAEHGMNIQEAIAAPRHHSQWLPDTISHEPRAFTKDTQQKLQALGHTLTPRRSIGQANAIHITPEGIQAAPDPRSNNAAAGN